MKKWSRRSVLGLFSAGFAFPYVSLSIQEGNKNNPSRLASALKKGDLVGVCAPAGGIKDPNEPNQFMKVLNEQGFRVKMGKNVSERLGYFSSSDTERAKEFMDLVADQEVKAVFFIRGGWGCARILPLIDFDVIASNPKIYMGFSDISSLLNAITERTGIVTFHGPNGNASWNERSISYLRKMAWESEMCMFQNLSEDLLPKTIVPGSTEGRLIGGNLTVLTAMIGTAYEPAWEGKILFLEEVHEEPYRIDRMLTQLEQHGVFKQIKGLVLGAFRDCVPEEKSRAFSVEEVFDQHFKQLDIPVYSNAQFGHVVNKFILPIGSKVLLDSSHCSIQMLEKVVTK
jgi:muramoyltetrapeptide carboxypeptidase